MNGRVYDPITARFLSADPIIQSPSNLQSLNRYSYVMNNPLSFVDPSGYWSLSKSLKKKWLKIRAVIKVIAAVVLAPACHAGSANACYAMVGLAESARNDFHNYNRQKKGSPPDRSSWDNVEIGVSVPFDHGSFDNSKPVPVAKPGYTAEANTTASQGTIGSPGVTGSSGMSSDILLYGIACSHADISACGVKVDAHRQLSPEDSAENIFMSGAHYYSRERFICAVGANGCSEASVFQAMLKEGSYPGQTKPLTGIGIERNNVELFPGDDHIRTYVGSNFLINVTEPDHGLHSGFVVRAVLTIDSSIYIRTTGGGTGPFGAINNAFKNYVWDPVDQKVINRFQ